MTVQTAQDQYVQVGQINTRFWTLGDGGSNVLLIHGLGGYLEHWQQNVEALADHHRVYALDLVGFGRSDKPEAAYSMPYFAQFVRDFMDTLGIERATLVGNSLGGSIALQFAIDFPDRVDKLVLVAGAGLGKDVNVFLRLTALPLVGEWLTRPSRQGAVRLFESCFYDPGLVPEEWIDRQYEIFSLPGAQQAYLVTARRNISLGGLRDETLGPIQDSLGDLAAPTLIVWGQQDTVLPVAHAHAGQKVMPNAQLQIFDSCGHAPQAERCEEFNRLVLEFLANSSTGRGSRR